MKNDNSFRCSPVDSRGSCAIEGPTRDGNQGHNIERREFFRLLARGGAGVALASGLVPVSPDGSDGAHAQERVSGAPSHGAKRSCDIVIVGAGLSGLTAARMLAAKNVDVLVLEAQDRVGGRTLTIHPHGTFIDHGGQWVSPGQDELMKLAKELGVSLFNTWGSMGATVDWHNGMRETYDTEFPSYWTQQDMDDAMNGVKTLAAMAKTFNLDAPWKAPEAVEWDDQTLDDWLAVNVGSELARSLIRRGIVGVFGSGPGRLSLLAALFVIESAEDLIRHFNPAGPDQRFVGGAQQLCNKMAEGLDRRVILDTWVSQVNQGRSHVDVFADNLSVRAKRAIITLPPTLAGRIRYLPALPAARDHLTESTPMGWVIKVHCVYRSRFWLDELGLSGAVTSDQGAIRTTADNSPETGSPAVLVGFIEGAAARELAPASEKTRLRVVLEDFQRYFGPEAAKPLAYYEHSWGDDAFSRGAYGGYWTEGLWTAYGPVLREPIGRLHWAGTETSPKWNGKMEGAVQSGIRVAQEVLAALG